jgi:hypothetical protein
VLLFAAFISLFALDVFSEEYSVGQTILALLVHLVPTWLILVVLAVAWRSAVVGGMLFILLGALFWAWFRQPVWTMSLLIA